MKEQEPSIVYWLGDNLYINITNHCSNNCYFCFRNYKNGVGSFKLKLNREPMTDEIIDKLKNAINKRQWKEAVFCGFGEPLMRLDAVLEVTRWLKRYHAAMNVRIDTNGQAQLFYKDRDVVDELKRAGLDKISVSLNAQNQEVYDQICKPRFENVYRAILDFVKASKQKFDTEVTAVTIPEVDLKKIEDIAYSLGVKFRKRDYVPCFW